MGNVDTTVRSTLKVGEDTRTSRRALETDVEVALEWPGSILIVEGLDESDGAIGLLLTLVLLSKAKLGQGAAGGEEASRVSYLQISGMPRIGRLAGYTPAVQLVRPWLMP